MKKYYNKNLRKQLKNLIDKPYFEEWFKMVEPILLSDEFQRRKLFPHHDSSVWNHTIIVSYHSFLLGRFYNLDEYTCAVGGLLHDFYPFAYKYNKDLEELDPKYVKIVGKKQKLREMHGFVHAREAAVNSMVFFPDLVNDKILSCIETHMFPLNIRPPKYKEGWIITYVDKKVSIDVVRGIKYVPNIIKDKIKHEMHFMKI